MIVVDPNQVSIFHVFGNGFGEKTVCLAVRTPGRFVKGYFSGVIMKQWPEDRVYEMRLWSVSSFSKCSAANVTGDQPSLGKHTRKSIIMPLGEIIGNKNRHSIVFVLQPLRHHIDLVFWHLKARPAIPLKLCCF